MFGNVSSSLTDHIELINNKTKLTLFFLCYDQLHQIPLYQSLGTVTSHDRGDRCTQTNLKNRFVIYYKDPIVKHAYFVICGNLGAGS